MVCLHTQAVLLMVDLLIFCRRCDCYYLDVSSTPPATATHTTYTTRTNSTSTTATTRGTTATTRTTTTSRSTTFTRTMSTAARSGDTSTTLPDSTRFSGSISSTTASMTSKTLIFEGWMVGTAGQSCASACVGKQPCNQAGIRQVLTRAHLAAVSFVDARTSIYNSSSPSVKTLGYTPA
jgi:hypothetical protein